MNNFSNNEPQNPQQPQQENSYQSPLQEQLAKDAANTKHKKSNSKAGYFFSGLVGVIIGALLVWLMLPGLANQLPNGGEVQTKQIATPKNVEQVATSVNSDITSAVEKASGAVVGISNIQEISDFWSQNANEQEIGAGSGVIYKVEGNKAFIVTNNHVVEKANKLEVTLQDGTKKEASLVGTDMWTDLAVISIDSKGIDKSDIIKFGNSDTLKQGEPVIAIGNPLGLEFYGSVTTGVISGMDRSIPVDFNKDGIADWQQEVLQTDAAISPGNSGGALVNVNGELIGINSMKIAETKVEGLSFAIPVNSVLPIITELEQHSKVERPALGVTLADLTSIPAFHQQQTLRLPNDITTGVVITDVVPNSAAAKAGAQQYDVITEMDGKEINSAVDLRKHLYNDKKVGDELEMKVYRQGEIKTLQVKLVANDTL